MSQRNQDSCEFPRLGFFEILGDKPSMLKDFHEITIGYLGIDKTEEKAKPGTISLRGHLSILDQTSKPPDPPPAFEVNGIPSTRRDLINHGFESAELASDDECKHSIKIVSEKFGNRQYIITANFLNKYKKAGGRLYNLVGRVEIVQDEHPSRTFRVRFARSRE